jgi:hypothetical protein
MNIGIQSDLAGLGPDDAVITFAHKGEENELPAVVRALGGSIGLATVAWLAERRLRNLPDDRRVGPAHSIRHQRRTTIGT